MGKTTGVCETCEGLTEALISHAQDPTEGGPRETRVSGAVQGGEEGGVDVDAGRWIAVIAMRLARDDGQVHVSLGADEGNGDGLGCARGAMLGGEQELLAVSAQGGKGGEVEASVAADTQEPLLDDRGGVLGHVDEHAAGLLDGEGV